MRTGRSARTSSTSASRRWRACAKLLCWGSTPSEALAVAIELRVGHIIQSNLVSVGIFGHHPDVNRSLGASPFWPLLTLLGRG
jgi:hypothetical protein